MTESPSQDARQGEKAFLEQSREFAPGLKERLRGIVGDRESVFLDLGTRVQDFAIAAEDLGTKATNLSDLISGDAVSDFAEQLDGKLGEMTGHCNILTGGKTSRHLDEVLEAVARLEEQMQGFRRVIRHLEMLGISTRIESARLGADGLGFHTLADDVHKLADRIAVYSEQIEEKSEQLTALARSALERTHSMHAMQEECSSRIFTLLQANIDQLRELMRSSQSVSMSLAPRSRDIAAGFGEIVASLQFHDITRQQVEHVEEALDDVSGVLVGDNNGEEYSSRELTCWIGDVCELQISQVANASERLVQAVERIKDNLGHVAGNVAELAGLAGSIGREGSGNGESVLAQIESVITKVVDTMHHMERQGREMAEVMVSVADTVAHMSAFVEDIENVGAEIELIAINASIKAGPDR